MIQIFNITINSDGRKILIDFGSGPSNYYIMPFCIHLLEHQPSGTLIINDTDSK